MQFKVWEIVYKWMALWVATTFQICPNPLVSVYRAWLTVRVLSCSHCLCAWILCAWNVLFCRAPPKHTPSPPVLRFPWYLYLPLRAPVTLHITAYISPFRLWILCWTHISLILTTISVLAQSRWLINICWRKRKEKKNSSRTKIRVSRLYVTSSRFTSFAGFLSFAFSYVEIQGLP